MLLGVFVVPSAVHATGVVSVNGGSTIQILKNQTTVSVPIDVSSSAGFNAFQIIVSADSSILQGASVSVSGSVLPSPTILAECLGGVLVAGTSCAAQASGTQFVELAVANQGGMSTTNPVSGLLFTITYNVVGLTGGTTIGFQNGCPTSSVASSTDCVQVNSGSTVNPETDASATFINNVDFSQTPVFAKLSTPAGVAIHDKINYAAIGPFVDQIGETVSCTSGLTCSLQAGSVDLTGSTTGNDNLTVSGNLTGSASIHACGLFNPGICQNLSIPVKISPPGFSIALSQSSVTISRGNSDSSTIITVTGFSSFSAPVSFSASTTGITGSASSATPVPNGSGYGTATSTLTITVASTVATGNYGLTVKGSSTGFPSSNQNMTVIVPLQNYTFSAVPSQISILRGASLSTTLHLVSLGNFAGTATFNATIAPVAGQIDSCCKTDNITPSFTPTSVALPAGGQVIDTFIATTIGGSANATTFTATGNYTAVVTATIKGITQSVLITFNIEDFTVGPSFCPGGNYVMTTPNSNNSFFASLSSAGNIVGTTCNSLTITSQPNVLFPYISVFGLTAAQVLWVQTSALGGLVTNGFNGTPAIAALNSAIPANGISVPQLAAVFPPNGTGSFFWPDRACVLPTFRNGVQLSYDYLATHGPLIMPGTGLYAFLSIVEPTVIGPGALGNWGCKFDSGAFPNDQGVAALNSFLAAHGLPTSFPTFNNLDFFGVTAMSLVGTVPGVYTFQLCGQGGILIHCNMYTLNVVAAPTIHQLVFPREVSFAGSGGAETFKLGIHNPGTSTIDLQVTVTASGDFGDVITATSPVIALGPGLDNNNIALSLPLTSTMVGETFSFSFSIAVGTDTVNLDSTSTVVTAGRASGTFHVVS